MFLLTLIHLSTKAQWDIGCWPAYIQCKPIDMFPMACLNGRRYKNTQPMNVSLNADAATRLQPKLVVSISLDTKYMKKKDEEEGEEEGEGVEVKDEEVVIYQSSSSSSVLILYFLVIALTQFIPVLRIGYLYTYWGPLVRQCNTHTHTHIYSFAHTHSHTHTHNVSSLQPKQGFFLAVTMTRELLNDFKRFLRDKEVNSQRFTKLTAKGSLLATYPLLPFNAHAYIHNTYICT